MSNVAVAELTKELDRINVCLDEVNNLLTCPEKDGNLVLINLKFKSFGFDGFAIKPGTPGWDFFLEFLQKASAHERAERVKVVEKIPATCCRGAK